MRDNKLTKEQKDYLLDRCDESSTGKVLVPVRLIVKYRNFTNDLSSEVYEIRNEIQYFYSNAKRG